MTFGCQNKELLILYTEVLPQLPESSIVEERSFEEFPCGCCWSKTLCGQKCLICLTPVYKRSNRWKAPNLLSDMCNMIVLWLKCSLRLRVYLLKKKNQSWKHPCMLVLSHHIFEASRSAQSYEYPLVILVLVIHVQEGERRIHKLRTIEPRSIDTCA